MSRHAPASKWRQGLCVSKALILRVMKLRPVWYGRRLHFWSGSHACKGCLLAWPWPHVVPYHSGYQKCGCRLLGKQKTKQKTKDKKDLILNTHPLWVWHGCVYHDAGNCVTIGMPFAIAVQAWNTKRNKHEKQKRTNTITDSMELKGSSMETCMSRKPNGKKALTPWS